MNDGRIQWSPEGNTGRICGHLQVSPWCRGNNFELLLSGELEEAQYLNPTQDTHIAMDCRIIKALEYSYPGTGPIEGMSHKAGIEPMETLPSKTAPPWFPRRRRRNRVAHFRVM
jgi:hypothetical protein